MQCKIKPFNVCLFTFNSKLNEVVHRIFMHELRVEKNLQTQLRLRLSTFKMAHMQIRDKTRPQFVRLLSLKFDQLTN